MRRETIDKYTFPKRSLLHTDKSVATAASLNQARPRNIHLSDSAAEQVDISTDEASTGIKRVRTEVMIQRCHRYADV